MQARAGFDDGLDEWAGRQFFGRAVLRFLGRNHDGRALGGESEATSDELVFAFPSRGSFIGK